MKPIVAVFAQGTMGAGIAGVLTQHGVSVLTSLDGRSSASVARAEAAGMQPVALHELARADIVLSVMPPAEALPFARRMVPMLSAVTHKPLFVDCNAVSPDTLQQVATAIGMSGAPFADVGIIGMPPRSGARPPRLYCAGAGAPLLATLAEYGLDIRVLEGPPGTASALKMAYGGITKGLIAVASAMILGASRAHVDQHLMRELADSEPELFASLSRRVLDMLPKAYRWVAEMQEISQFLAADDASSAVYRGIAQLYERVATDVAAAGQEAATLKQFFSKPASG